MNSTPAKFAVFWLLFLLPGFLYFSAFNGITSSNDGSHYALLRAVVDTGSPVVDPFLDYTERNDYSRYGDHYYSDRPPGTAILAAPFYLIGRALSDISPAIPSKWDAGNRAIGFMLLAPTCALFLLTFLFYRMQRRLLGVRPFYALLGSTAFLLATPAWKYGTSLFSHAFSACLIFGSVYLAMQMDPLGKTRASLLGLLLGASVAVEYQNAVVVLVVGLWVLGTRRIRTRETLFAFVAGGAAVAIPLLLYFKTCFGGWFSTSYSARVNDPWSRSIIATFSGSILDGLVGLLWINKDGAGWLLRMPFVAFGIVGFLRARDSAFRMLLLPLIVLVSMILLFSSHYTFHGFTGDGRYILPYLALALIPAPFCLQWTFDRWRPGGMAATTVFLLSMAWGFLGASSVLAHSFGQPELIMPFPYRSWWPHPYTELAKALPNLSNWPSFLVLYLLAGLVGLSVVAAMKALRARSSSVPRSVPVA